MHLKSPIHVIPFGSEALESRVLFSAGDLDPSYGDGGTAAQSFQYLAQTDVGGMDIRNNKTTVAGVVQTTSNVFELAVARYRSDGQVETAFSGDGFASYALSGINLSSDVLDVLVQGNGNTVVLARITNQWELVRFTPAGVLDKSFGGGDGRASIPLQNVGKLAESPAGHVYVSGSTANADDFAVARFNNDGTLDGSFGHASGSLKGIARMTFTDNGPSYFHGNAIAVQPDGKVVVVGDQAPPSGDNNNPHTNARIVRFNASGSKDTSFGAGTGYVVVNVGGNSDSTSSVAVGFGGRIIVGAANNGANTRPIILLPTGGLERFNEQVNQYPFAQSYQYVNDIWQQPDGKVVAIVEVQGVLGQTFAARWNTDGSLDSTFGENGLQRVRGRFGDFQSDGSFIVAGPLADPGAHFYLDTGMAPSRYQIAPGPVVDPITLTGSEVTVTGTRFNDTIRIYDIPAQPSQGLPARIEIVTFDSTRIITRSSLSDITVRAGAGNDRVLALDTSFPVVIYGQDGNDFLQGGAGNDWFIGGRGADFMIGNGGDDTVYYGDRTANLRIDTQDGLDNDGEAGERDNVAGDIEVIVAGSGNDDVRGSSVNNLIYGGGGNDVIYGRQGNDQLVGDAGSDRLYGGVDDDILDGLDGGVPDYLDGGLGIDTAKKDGADATTSVEY